MASITCFSIAISRSPLAASQFFEHHVPQVVQRLSELYRIDQGTAAPVVPVQAVQILARNQERCDAFAVVSDADLGQVATAGQQISPSEDVRGFKADGLQ
jgi:hypothetical protein